MGILLEPLSKRLQTSWARYVAFGHKNSFANVAGSAFLPSSQSHFQVYIRPAPQRTRGTPPGERGSQETEKCTSNNGNGTSPAKSPLMGSWRSTEGRRNFRPRSAEFMVGRERSATSRGVRR